MSEGLEQAEVQPWVPTAQKTLETLDPQILAQYKYTEEYFEELVYKYCRDITSIVAAGKSDPIIGRDKEVDQLTTILIQRGRSNAAILGPAGTGKTALFFALAQNIYDGDRPHILSNARVLELDLVLMASGTVRRSEFEGRFIPLIKAIAERNSIGGRGLIIICLDEIHTLMHGCKASSAEGLADAMKPYMTAGELLIVGATTSDEYMQYVKKDPAIDRRFQKIILKEPNEDQTLTILRGLKGKYEKHFDITIPDEKLELIVALTSRFLRKRNHPDKDILLMDSACAYAIKAGMRGKELDDMSLSKAIEAETGLDRRAII